MLITYFLCGARIALALHYFCTMKREGTVDWVYFSPIID